MDNKQFFININGTKVEVTKEVYLVYYRSKRRDRYYEQDIKTETAIRNKEGNIIGYAPSKEDSLNRLIDVGEDFTDKQETVEDIVIRNLMSGVLHKSLDKLSKVDRELIDALFFSDGGEGMTEREYSVISKIPQKTINDRKNKALIKMKKILENKK